MKNNDFNIWQEEFELYAAGNNRINAIASYLRKSNKIKTLFDLGCNNCLLGKMNLHIDYYGADWILSGETNNFNVVQYDINSGKQLPFEISFDAIVMSGILEYAENPSILLENVAKRINPDGYLFVSYVNFNYISRIIRKCFNIENFLHPTWKNFTDYKTLRKTFKLNNLHIMREMSIDLPFPRFGINKIFGEPIYERNFMDLLSKQKLFILKKTDT